MKKVLLKSLQISPVVVFASLIAWGGGAAKAAKTPVTPALKHFTASLDERGEAGKDPDTTLRTQDLEIKTPAGMTAQVPVSPEQSPATPSELEKNQPVQQRRSSHREHHWPSHLRFSTI